MSEFPTTTRQPKDRLVNSFSFLIPAKKYTIDFDITATNSLPAFLEISIYLLDTLKFLSPYELQSFLGISDGEREELLRQIISIDLAFLNDDGVLEATHKLNELKQNDGTIQLEGIERHTSSFYIDLLSEHIQPRASSSNTSGFHEVISEDILYKELDADVIFKNDFNRFKYCSKVESIKKIKTRLYRINSCHYDKLISFPASVDIYSQWQSDGRLKMYSSLSGFDGENLDIVVNSGLLGHINTILNQQSMQCDTLSIQNFCSHVQDDILVRYEGDEGVFNIEKYLRDRDNRKTGYGSSKTSGIIGPIFLPHNKGSFLNWLARTPKIQPIFWIPASTQYWGASLHSRAFYEQTAELLPKKLSSLSLAFPKVVSSQEKYAYRQQYGGIADILLSFHNAVPLNEMEIMIVPGSPCWAMVQYHARIIPAYGLRNIRIPVGYTTYDQDRVKLLWELALKRLGFDNPKHVEILGDGQVSSEILECLIYEHDWSEHFDFAEPSGDEIDAVD